MSEFDGVPSTVPAASSPGSAEAAETSPPTSSAAASSPQENEVVDAEGEGKPKVTEEPPIPKGVQKRIDRAVRRQYEAEAEARVLREQLARMPAAGAPSSPRETVDAAEPRLENFQNFDEFVSAKATWISQQQVTRILEEREQKARGAQEAQSQQEIERDWHERREKATDEIPDFEDVISSSNVPMTPLMEQAIKESDVGPRLAYHLALNPKEALRIAQMSPVRAVTALGRLEERLQNAVPATSKAPPPISPSGSRAAVSKDPDKMSTEEWLSWRQAQLKKRA